MKKLILLFGLLLSFFVNAQQIEKELVVKDWLTVGSGEQASSNAILDISSDSKGVKFPILTTTERDGITTTALDSGLVIYNSTDSIYQYFSGAQWLDMGGGDNMANADLSLTSDRFHLLGGNKLTLLGNEVGAFLIKNSALHGINPTNANGISLYQKSNGLNFINGSGAGTYIGSSGNNNLFLLGSGKSKFQGDLQVAGTGFVGGAGAKLKVIGSDMSSSTNTILFENSGGQEIFRINNGRQSFIRSTTITGLGSTSATTSLLVENSTGTELLKVNDIGSVSIEGATTINNTLNTTREITLNSTLSNQYISATHSGINKARIGFDSGGFGICEVRSTSGTLNWKVRANKQQFYDLTGNNNIFDIEFFSSSALTIRDKTNSNAWQFVNWGAYKLPVITVSDVGSASDGMIIYVSDTDATFTSVGFWGRENGSWVKL